MSAFLHSEVIELPEREFTHFHMEDGNSYFLDSEEKRFYSISKILSHATKKSIEQWRKWVGEAQADLIGNAAKERGHVLHKGIENYLNNLQTEEGSPLLCIMRPLLDRLTRIRGIELPLYCEDLMLVGRCDCVAEFDGVLSIIDFKGATKAKKRSAIGKYFLQATAYSLMLEARTGIRIDDLAILVAAEDGSSESFTGKRSKYENKLRAAIAKFHGDLPR